MSSKSANILNNDITLFFQSIVALLFVSVLLWSCESGKSKKNEDKRATLYQDTISVEAPFEMPSILVPNFEGCPSFPITDFGAETGDKEKNTQAIANAIDAANQAGCGTVRVPAGEWLTGKIHFKSNVNLNLEEGATLLFSGDPDDYKPSVHTSWAGMELYNYSPLIYAYECENIALTGKGKLQPIMDTWKEWFKRPPAHMNSLVRLYTLLSENAPVEERNFVNDTSNLRPHFIQFNRSSHIKVEGITIKDSPFWVVHPYICRDVVIRNVSIKAHGHNNDGIDPDMSQNVLIENCTFDQGDDAIAIKAGRNQDGWRINVPTKNVVVRNCTIKNGHQLMAIGSEVSAGIENVYIDNCRLLDGAEKSSQWSVLTNNLIFIKTNEQRGGYVRNIYANNIQAGKIKHSILGIDTDVLYQWRGLVETVDRKLTKVSDIHLSNIQASSVSHISHIKGLEELPIENIFLENVSSDTVRAERNIHSHVLNFDGEMETEH